jgi:hypothetical protein
MLSYMLIQFDIITVNSLWVTRTYHYIEAGTIEIYSTIKEKEEINALYEYTVYP